MIDLSDLPQDERDILKLIDASETMQKTRGVAAIHQMLDVGDRILAQQIVKRAANSPDPTPATVTP